MMRLLLGVSCEPVADYITNLFPLPFQRGEGQGEGLKVVNRSYVTAFTAPLTLIPLPPKMGGEGRLASSSTNILEVNYKNLPTTWGRYLIINSCGAYARRRHVDGLKAGS